MGGVGAVGGGRRRASGGGTWGGGEEEQGGSNRPFFRPSIDSALSFLLFYGNGDF